MNCKNCGAPLKIHMECDYCKTQELTSTCSYADRFSDFYKKYPDLFVETYLNIRLFPYQKAILRKMIGIN